MRDAYYSQRLSPNLTFNPSNEYLGPAPYVSGYYFSANERKIMVEWWDIYLHEQWIGNERWEISLYFDTTVQGWVTRPRGDPDNSLDMKEYLGC